MERGKTTALGGLTVVSLNESDLDPVIAGNLSGTFPNSGHIGSADIENDFHNISTFSQKSSSSLSFDVKKFSARLSSHMSNFSDTLFSDIEDIEDLAEQQSANQESQVDNPSVKQSNTLQSVIKQHAKLNDGALYIPSSSASFPRTTTPQPNGVTVLQGIPEEVTPTKSIQPEIDPLTPTANLKVLISAASPEIRNRERQKLNETGEFDPTSTSFMSAGENTGDIVLTDAQNSMIPVGTIFTSEKLAGNKDGNFEISQKVVHLKRENFDWENIEPSVSLSRKEKSLGLLCQR